MATTGSLSLNGITDSDLIKILEVKDKTAGALQFAPENLRQMPQNIAPGQPVRQRQIYGNATFAWADNKGLAGVIEILKHIHEQQ